MCRLQTTTTAARATCMLAASIVTSLLLGGQLLIADGYARQADAAMAAQRAQQAATQRAVATPATRS